MTTTTSKLTETADLALDLATDGGQRTWRPGFTPRTENAQGGYDFHTFGGGVTVRLVEDDTLLRLYVFTGGRAMLLRDEATFTSDGAHLAASYMAEGLR